MCEFEGHTSHFSLVYSPYMLFSLPACQQKHIYVVPT